MKFKELSIGQEFIFERERVMNWRYYGLASGPWIKTSAKKYVHKDPERYPGDLRIGSINVQVVPVEYETEE